MVLSGPLDLWVRLVLLPEIPAERVILEAQAFKDRPEQSQYIVG
jgi:hypothetical protein